MNKPAYFNSSFFKILKKFQKLYKKLVRLFQNGNFSLLKPLEKHNLLSRFTKTYQQLESLQVRKGLKITGAALAFSLIINTAKSQTFIPASAIENPFTTGYNPFGNLIEPSGASIDLPLFQLVDLDNDGDYDLIVARNTLDYKKLGSFFERDKNLKIFNKADRNTKGWTVTLEYYENIGTPENAVYAKREGENNPFNGLELGNVLYTNILMVDVDGDGDFDLIYNEIDPVTYNSSLSFFRNEGTLENPLFVKDNGETSPFYGLSFLEPVTPSLVDIDNDGSLDLILSSYGGPLIFYKNISEEGGYDFELVPELESPFAGIESFFLTRPEFVDFDNDGDYDLFVAAWYGNIEYYKNIGTVEAPNFELQLGDNNPFIDFISGAYFGYPSFADIDNDGDIDIAVGQFGMAEFIEYYENIGTPENGLLKRMGGFKATYIANVELVDLDGDGDLDLVVGQLYGGIDYYENTGDSKNPVFEKRTGEDSPFNDLVFGSMVSPTFVDIDGDGNYDMIVSQDNSGLETLFFKNTGTPTNPQFELQAVNPVVDLFSYSFFVSKLVFVDIDGDGDFDAFGIVGQNFAFFKNTGDAQNPVFELSAADNPLPDFGLNSLGMISGFDFSDLSGNGLYDLAVGTYTEDESKLYYFENIGDAQNPEFEIAVENPFELLETGLFASVKLSDIDDDGDADLITGDYFGYIRFFKNTTVAPVATHFDITNITSSSAMLNITPSENSNAFFVVVNSGETAPTINDVIAGTGNAGSSAVFANNEFVNILGDSFLITSLSPNSNYTLYLVLDNQTKTISELYSIDFTSKSTSVFEVKDEIEVYPNPSEAYFFIKMSNIETIEVFDIRGQRVLSESIGADNYLLDLSGNSKGIYLIKIIANGKSYTHKVALQ